MNPTSFAIKTQRQGDVSVIVVRGELDLHTAPQLEASVDGVLERGAGPMAIDLSACEFIDSTGIALIVRACRQLNGNCGGAANGCFALSGLSDQVQRLFDITGLESLIPLHATVDEAVAALSQ